MLRPCLLVLVIAAMAGCDDPASSPDLPPDGQVEVSQDAADNDVSQPDAEVSDDADVVTDADPSEVDVHDVDGETLDAEVSDDADAVTDADSSEVDVQDVDGETLDDGGGGGDADAVLEADDSGAEDAADTPPDSDADVDVDVDVPDVDPSPSGELFSIACNVGECRVGGSFDVAALAADGTLFAAGAHLRLVKLSATNWKDKYQVGVTAFSSANIELFEYWESQSVSLGPQTNAVDIALGTDTFAVLTHVDDTEFNTSSLRATLHDATSGAFGYYQDVSVGGGFSGFITELEPGIWIGRSNPVEGTPISGERNAFAVVPGAAVDDDPVKVFGDTGITTVVEGAPSLVTIKNGQWVDYGADFVVSGFVPFPDANPDRVIAGETGDWMVIGETSDGSQRIARYDAALTLLFETTLSDPAGALTTTELFDLGGDTLVVGRLACPGVFGAGAIWVALVDVSGAVTWQRYVTGYERSEAQAAALGSDGSLLIADLIYSAVSDEDFAWRLSIAPSDLAAGTFGSATPACLQWPVETGCWSRDDVGDTTIGADGRIYSDAGIWDAASGMGLGHHLEGYDFVSATPDLVVGANFGSHLQVEVTDASGNQVLASSTNIDDISGKGHIAAGTQRVWLAGITKPDTNGDQAMALYSVAQEVLAHGPLGMGQVQQVIGLTVDPTTGGARIGARSDNVLDYADFSVWVTDSDGSLLDTFTHSTPTNDIPRAIASAPDGSTVVVGNREGTTNGGLLVHFAADGTVLVEYPSVDIPLYRAVATDGVSAWVGGSDGAQRIDLATGAVTASAPDFEVQRLHLLGPDRVLLETFSDGVTVLNGNLESCQP